MQRPTVPCIDCEDREVGCHGKCEKYLEFSKVVEKQRDAKNEAIASSKNTRTSRYYKYMSKQRGEK